MANKPPLVILHGWSLSGATFAPLVDVFQKKGYTVYAPDLPGFGKTQTPDHPLYLADYATYLNRYLQTHHIEHPVFIGHSFGGRVSLKYQQMHPNSVRALILSGTPGFTPTSKKKLFLFILIAKIGNIFFSIPPLHLLKNYVRRWYYYIVGAKEFFRAEGSMRDTFKNIVQENLVSAMEAVTVPCLLVWGELDVIVPEAIAERMHRVIVGSQFVVIPDATHGVPFNNPEEFVRYADRFLNKI